MLQAALGVVLFAALLKWAAERKRRVLAVGIGALALLFCAVFMLVWQLLFGLSNRRQKLYAKRSVRGGCSY